VKRSSVKKSLLLVIFLLVQNSLFAAISTEKKIQKSEKILDESLKEQKETSEQLDKVADDIKKANSENKILNSKLETLSDLYQQNEESYQASKKELSAYDASLAQINKKIEDINEEFIQVLASQSSVIHAMNQKHDPSRESIVMLEAYHILKEKNAKDMGRLKEQIDQKKREKRSIQKDRSRIKIKIDKIAKERDEFEDKKKTKEKLLEKLANDEESYRKKLQSVMDEQNALRSTLAELNILQQKEVEEERRIAAEQKAAMLAEEQRKKALRKKRAQERAQAKKEGKKVVYAVKEEEEEEVTKGVAEGPIEKVEVARRGSSYQADKVAAYSGGKTISPIQGARLIKKFGAYVDPIYKIKIFNESITLQAPSSDARVQNVLNGKVVFAGPSSMLGNVVVVAHAGQMHTVYAGLSKIAPSISKGSTIRGGYVIGKVSNKLIFQATKDSKHIDPLKLITL